MSNLTQQTLVVMKPDAMERGLAGEIISRLEKAGLKIVAAKLVKVDEKLAKAHYPVTDEWLETVGNKSLGDYEKFGLDPIATMGTSEAKEIGKQIHQFNIKYLMEAPVLALVFQGNHAVELVRKLVGSTLPLLAAPGTIRGDYSNESAIVANADKRSIKNLVHASGEVEEAKREISLWFPEFEAN